MNANEIAHARADAHEKLNDILDAKEEWSWPLVATVVVEEPGIGEYIRQQRS